MFVCIHYCTKNITHPTKSRSIMNVSLCKVTLLRRNCTHRRWKTLFLQFYSTVQIQDTCKSKQVCFRDGHWLERCKYFQSSIVQNNTILLLKHENQIPSSLWFKTQWNEGLWLILNDSFINVFRLNWIDQLIKENELIIRIHCPFWNSGLYMILKSNNRQIGLEIHGCSGLWYKSTTGI